MTGSPGNQGSDHRFPVAETGRLGTRASTREPSAKACPGFSLTEAMIAVLLLSGGLLAAAAWLDLSRRAATLSRTRAFAVLAAQNRLETLAEEFRRAPDAPDLVEGSHGPETEELRAVPSGALLNRCELRWTVSRVPDPRPGKVMSSRYVVVTAIPVTDSGMPNLKPGLNQAVSLATVLDPAP